MGALKGFSASEEVQSQHIIFWSDQSTKVPQIICHTLEDAKKR